jgi:hypothetical protein
MRLRGKKSRSTQWRLQKMRAKQSLLDLNVWTPKEDMENWKLNKENSAKHL